MFQFGSDVMNSIGRCLCVFSLLFLAISGWGQQAKVVSMTETIDIIAGDDQRRDFNGALCALVKVQVVDDITDVEGNVMGEIVNHGVEKWVYMAKDSRSMTIHLKNNLPLKVVFNDYKIKGLASNRVYVLTLEVPKTDSGNGTSVTKQGELLFRVTPANANVTIWSSPSDKRLFRPQQDGTIKTSVPYGRYHYVAQAKGCTDKIGSVFVNDESRWEIVDLTEGKGTKKDVQQKKEEERRMKAFELEKLKRIKAQQAEAEKKEAKLEKQKKEKKKKKNKKDEKSDNGWVTNVK